MKRNKAVNITVYLIWLLLFLGFVLACGIRY